MKKIEAFEMRSYRRLLRIPFTGHRTNVSVREEINSIHKQVPLIVSVRKRKLQFLVILFFPAVCHWLFFRVVLLEVMAEAGPECHGLIILVHGLHLTCIPCSLLHAIDFYGAGLFMLALWRPNGLRAKGLWWWWWLYEWGILLVNVVSRFDH